MKLDPEHDRDDPVSARIRRDATRYTAPPELRARVLSQVALMEASRPARPASPAAPWWQRLRRFLAIAPWRTATAGFAVGAACAVLLAPVARELARGPLEAELVAEHVHAMREGPLIQVASSDRHTVKPWYQGKLDFSPPVHDLVAEGFPLMGGRVDHVRGQAVAALTYARDKHLIDVFVWPSEDAAPAAFVERRGFNLVRWNDGAMRLWAVSDVERSELERFVQLWQAQSGAR